MVVILEENAT